MATIKTFFGAPEGKKPQGGLRGLMVKLTNALTGGMFTAKAPQKQPTVKGVSSRGREPVREAKPQERVLQRGMQSHDEVVRLATETAERVAAKRLRDRYVGRVVHPDEVSPKVKEALPAFNVEEFLHPPKTGRMIVRDEPEYGNGMSPGSGVGTSRRRVYNLMKIEQTGIKPDKEASQAPSSTQKTQQGGVKRKVTRFFGLSH